MNLRNVRLLVRIALATVFVASASVASAQGLLGKRYVGGIFGCLHWDDEFLDDGWAVGLIYNHPLANNLDLSLGYSHTQTSFDDDESEEEFDDDISACDVYFGATWFNPCSYGNIYVRANIGYVKTEVGNFDEDDSYYHVELGYEIKPPWCANGAITPYIGYSDTFDSDGDGSFTFGTMGEYVLDSKWSVLGDVTVDDDSNWSIGAGLAFRF